ncbi:MAG: sulfite exporter TauE/SafE family protein [Actinomycetota bacterium]
MPKTKQRRRAASARRKRELSPERQALKKERRGRRDQFEQLVATRDRRQRQIVAACLIGIAVLVVVAARFSPAVPDAEAGRANLLLVFLTGLTAGGLSCLAVQGGLLATAVAQREDTDLDTLRERYVSGESEDLTIPRHNAKPVMWFLIAKVSAYTLLGIALGWLGNTIQPSPVARGYMQIFTALFMVATALHLLRVHPIFRYVIIQPPRFITRRISKEARSDSAFAPATLGAMTVFLPCGVTQAMMILAINSGSPLVGGTTMLTFTLATSPLFFMLGYFATKLGDIMQSRFTKFAAVGIAAIALLTLDAGLRLTNSPVTFASVKNSLFSQPEPVAAKAGADGVQEARIDAGRGGYSPSRVTIAANEPARLVFANAGGGCTLSLVFQGQLYQIAGETTIDLLAQKPGEIRYSCAMGMYGGTIAILDGKETSA